MTFVLAGTPPASKRLDLEGNTPGAAAAHSC